MHLYRFVWKHRLLLWNCYRSGTFLVMFKLFQVNADSERIVIALQEYVPSRDMDLPLEKGHEYVLINKSNTDWWTVRNGNGYGTLKLPTHRNNKWPNRRLFAPYLPGTLALYPAHMWQKKMAAVLKDFSEFYLIDPAVAKNISDNGLRPLIESFVCHRWYSKNMNRMQAQELLMREVKSQKKPTLENVWLLPYFPSLFLMGLSGCLWAAKLLMSKCHANPRPCKACAPVCHKPSVTYNPKNVWQPQPPPPPHPGWTSCSVWFGFAHVKLSIYPCAGFIFCFYNNSVRCALSVPCFTFREKKVPSWFGTRATWESTQCQSSQRHRGNSFNFLFDLNMIQIMSPVQSGSFSVQTARPLSYPATAIILKKRWNTLVH